MSIVAAFQRLASAATVFFGSHGAVTEAAQQRGVPRQTLYREAEAAHDAVEGSADQQRFLSMQKQIDELQQQLRQYQQQDQDRQRYTVILDPDKQQEFASTAQAEGVSLPVTYRLLRIFLAQQTPCVAQLGRQSAAAAKRAAPLLEVLDEHTRPLVTQAAPDEIFVGAQPVLMVVEPESLCWVSGRKAPTRDGQEWAKEFRLLPALEQVNRDAGTALQKGLRLVNQERSRQGQPAIADALDHFHTLREGGRALRKSQGRASKALEKAEKAQGKLRRLKRHGQAKTGYATQAARRWQEAEQAFDAWTAQERAWADIASALRLFTPEGKLNTRARAQRLVAEALPALEGEQWSKTKRLLQRPETFTYLDRVQEQLAGVPVAAELREAIVRSEGVRRRPELAQGESKDAAVVRGLLLVWGVVIASAGAAGQEAVGRVRGILRRAFRASSAVEGLNSVVRMQQSRHRRLTQGLLDLKRLYWNTRAFRTGRRRRRSPYQLVGLMLPALTWWQLLKLSPEQLRLLLQKKAPEHVPQNVPAQPPQHPPQEVSAQQVAA